MKYTIPQSSCYWIVDKIWHESDEYVKVSMRTFLKDTGGYLAVLSGKHKIIRSVYGNWVEYKG